MIEKGESAMTRKGKLWPVATPRVATPRVVTPRVLARLVVAVAVVLAASACSLELPQGESGSIPFIPVFNEELGIQGVVPLGCERQDADSHNCTGVSPDQSALIIVQAVLPESRDDLASLLQEQTGLSQLPESTGRYKGSGLTWDLYAFEAQLVESGPEILWLDLALAEKDEQAYLVAMVTLPDDHERHAAWYDTVFTHVVYALKPLDS